MYAFQIACSVALGLIVLLLLLLWGKLGALLKDKSVLPVDERSYSLSSTLIFYWTIIVTGSLCYIGIVSDNVPEISAGAVALMGIAAGTTTAGKLIDSTQSTDPTIARAQDTTPTKGFFTDILSDGTGISVSRFQTVVFHIIYGAVFISLVVSQHVLYNFPNQTLTLLGISSGAYALLKIPENTRCTVTPPPCPPADPQPPIKP